MIVELDIDVLSWFDRQSEKTVLYLEPIAGFQHQLLDKWNPCVRVLLLGLSIVAKYTGGCADRAEPIVAKHVTAETMIRSQREGLEA